MLTQNLSLLGSDLGGKSKWKISSVLSCVTEEGIWQTELPRGHTQDLNWGSLLGLTPGGVEIVPVASGIEDITCRQSERLLRL